jgi:hypothetical protein
MRRSLQVSAPLLAAMALSLTTGCRKPQMQRCVDEQNRVVPDSFCRNPQQRSSNGLFLPMHRYYYGGNGGFAVGTPVYGGGYSSVGGASYSTGTARGGFGSSFSGGSSGSGSSGSSSGSGS